MLHPQVVVMLEFESEGIIAQTFIGHREPGRIAAAGRVGLLDERPQTWPSLWFAGAASTDEYQRR
jgi:hypothetical protein